jgi:hypothetical protein
MMQTLAALPALGAVMLPLGRAGSVEGSCRRAGHARRPAPRRGLAASGAVTGGASRIARGLHRFASALPGTASGLEENPR